MEANNNNLGKWDLNHLSELIQVYLGDRYPEKRYKLLKTGSLVSYTWLPKWWARMWNKFELIPFMSIAKEIYRKMTGATLQIDNFGSTYLQESDKGIIDVLFLIHVMYMNGSPLESSIAEKYECRSDETIIQLADGPYKVTTVPVNFLLPKKGEELMTVEQLLKAVRRNYR